MATEKQLNYLDSLLRERLLSSDPGKDAAARKRGFDKVDANSISVTEASTMISWLRERPKLVEKAPESALQVASGRYAVKRDGVLKFYKVDVVTEGKWAGRTFVSRQHGGDVSPVRDRVQRDQILKAIAADPEKALRAYGHALGHCGHCGRALTDESSRAAGIGPVCAKGLGISMEPGSWDEQFDAVEIESADKQEKQETIVYTSGELPKTFRQLAREVAQ